MEPNLQQAQPSHFTNVYKVNIPIFEGPLDLLLQLIEHAELDITIVSLALVTDQYLAYIHKMQVPAGEISAFLVVAAKLIQIKSEALLPRPPRREAGEEDLGEALTSQLRIYKQFKEKSKWLEDREARHLRTFLRVAPPLRVERHLDLSSLTLAELVTAAENIFNDEAEKQALETVIQAPRITIREKITLIVEHLGRYQNITFGRLLSLKPTRLEVVVTFLALLELVKRFRVSTHQEVLFSDIQINMLEGLGNEEELEIEFE